MKKLLIGLGLLVVVIVAAVFVVTPLVNWKILEPRIADAVRDATGRELRIEGEIRVSLVPLELRLSGVRLSNAKGMRAPDMVSVASVEARLGLLALLSRSVVVESFVVREPAIFLEVDKTGRPNWVFETAAAPDAPPEPAEAPAAEDAGLPISDLQLVDVRIEQGLFSYVDASTGQSVQVKDLSLKLALAGLGSPFTLAGRLTLNGEPVKLDVSLDSPQAMLGAERAKVALALASKHITASYDGALQQQPVPGLDGALDLDVASVGALAAWLGQPLDEAQPDPGPLNVHAVLTADGPKVVLKEAVIKGAALDVRASGSFDGSGEIAKVVVNVESGVLDIDRYLPPPVDAKPAAEQAEEPAPGGDMLAMLPDTPFDLAPLRQTEADVNVAIGGIKAMGFEVGRIAFATTLKGGVLAANLSDLGLYGGNVKGTVDLDASGDALGVAVAITVDAVNLGRLAEVATGGEAPVAGILSSTITANGKGASPRALVEGLSAKVAVDLGGIDVKDAPVGAISELKLALDLPGLENPPSLTASVVYNKERVVLDLTLDPLKTVLAGDRFALKAAVASKLVSVSYDGAVQQKPIPGLDGALDLDVGSVGALAAWLGQPLDKAQPDPGPLNVHAALTADGPKVVLKEAVIKGTALDVRASGSFDGSGDIAKVALNIESGVLDIDRYLPPPEEAKPAAKKAERPAPGGDMLAMLPDAPFDLAPLRQTEADVNVAIGGIKAMGFEVGRIAFATTLKGGVLAAELSELGLYGGNVKGTVGLDASGDALGVAVAMAVDAVNLGQLAEVATGGEAPIAGILSSTITASGKGVSPRALVEGLSAKVGVDLGGIDMKDAPVGAISELKLALDLPGIESPPSLKASVVYNKERVALDLTLDALKKILAGDRFALKAAVASKHVNASYDGAVQQQPVPGLDGALDLDVASVGALAAWLGQPLDEAQPDPGPLNVHAALTADGPKVVLKEAVIKGTALDVRASGSFDGSGDIAKVVVNVESGVLDIDRYLPPPSDEAIPAAEQAEEPAPGGDMLAMLPAEPFDLSPLRQTEADVNVAIGGIKAMGFEVGGITFATTLKKGVLAANLSQLALYGGSVKGTIELDASGAALGVAVAMAVDGLDVAKLARAATGEDAPVAGILSSTITANGNGASPRALVEGLSAKVAVDLGGIDMKDAPVGAISELKLALDLPGFESQPSLKGGVVYNKERVEIDLTLDALKKILAGERFALKAAVASKHVNVSYDGAVQQQPVPGLDGALDLDVPSVGALAAWLGQPLDAAQPDPGPLNVHATLTADGPKVVLKEAVIKGTALDARASGSFDGSGKIAKVVLNIESGVLDIDRYLPPPSGEAMPAAEQAEEPAPGGDMLAALPDTPFDLAPLRQTEADINVAIGGIKAMGFEVGGIAFATTLKKGVLAAKLSQLGLYGGNVKGTVKLDASGAALGVAVAMAIDGIDVEKLARAATGEEPPVAGILSSTINASGKGANPRALVESLSAKVAVDLGGIDMKDAPVGAISELKIALNLPGLEKPPSLKGRVVYNKERVALNLTLDPIKKILSGDRFALKAAVASKHVNVSYDGAVQQQPVPGLDGALDLDVASVGRLAAWLGQPLDKAQPDPGPLKVHAVLTADGPKVVLKEATIKGKALDARASGSFDGSGDIAKVVVNLESGVLDIDRYLPPPVEAKPAAEPAQQPAGPDDMLAMVPDTPFDLAPLRQTEADVNVAIGGIKAMGFEVGRIAFATTLKGGVLAAKLSQLGLYGGNVKGTIDLDASGDALGVAVAMAVDGIDVAKLARAATGEEPPVAGILSSTLSANGKGANPRALVEGLSAKVAVDLGGIDMKDAPVGAISELKLALDLPGLESPPSLKGSVVYNKERVALDLTLDPIKTVLAGERFALKAAVASKHVNASYDGAVQQKPIPGLDGALDLDVASVGQLAAWLGQPLDAAQPDPGPLTVHAALTADGPKVVLKEAVIKGTALDARASGSFDGSGKIALFAANVDVQQADLNAYLPPTAAEEAPAKEQPAEQQAAAGWSEEPIDFGPLHQAEGEARITIGTVLYKDLTIKSGLITVTLAGGVLRSTIENLQMADGTVDTSVTLDASRPAATLDYQATIAGVESQALLKSLADNDRLSGKADFRAKGSARGSNQKQLVETLNGDGSFRFLDGAIHGIDLAATLRKAKTLGMGTEGDTAQKTDFAEVSGSFVITNGVLENRDFKMLAPLLRVSGEGTVPMPPQTVDYRAEVKLVATTKGQGGDDALAGLPIPINISGPWSNPSYGVDWSSVFSGMDPSRLANMPAGLRDAAEGAGISLPIPEVLGGAGLGGILKAIPGLGGTQEETPATSEPSTGGGVVEQMQQLFKPAPTTAPATTAPATTAPATTEPPKEEEPALPAPIKSLKRLFGG